MNHRNVLSTAFLVCISFAPLLGQAANNEGHTRKKPADPVELAAIAERGRAIAAYDEAAWHATDAVQALKPAEDAVHMYIGKRSDAGWTMAFGKLNETKDVFLLAY